jgi:hypothetical protein
MENKYKEREKQSYVSEFLAMKCSGDVLNAVTPLNNAEKEISESMAIIKRLRSIVLAEPMKYKVLDLCAGNALTSVLAVHLLPIKEAIAVDIKPRERLGYQAVKRFTYVTGDIREHHSMAFPDSHKDIIIISSHPCKLARRIIEIYNKTSAKAMIIIPCCEGPLKRQYPQILKEKMGAYIQWCFDLALDCEGSLTVDKKIISPKNCVIVAKRNMTHQLDDRPNCKFLSCFAGGGVAGSGHCFLGGDPKDKNCPKFKDEEEALREWEERRGEKT